MGDGVAVEGRGAASRRCLERIRGCRDISGLCFVRTPESLGAHLINCTGDKRIQMSALFGNCQGMAALRSLLFNDRTDKEKRRRQVAPDNSNKAS